MGSDVELGADDAVEGEEGEVVEDDGGELFGLDEGLSEAVVDGVAREAWVVLLAREALLLRGGDDLAVADEGRGRVVVEGRDPENRHAHGRAPLRSPNQPIEPGTGGGEPTLAPSSCR